MNARFPLHLLIPILLSAACGGATGSRSGIGPGSVLVVNQGQFQQGNATISLLDPETGEVTLDVFQSANGRPLGDVAQSVTPFNGRLYVVVNNSHKVEVLNGSTFVSEGVIAIPDNAGPRHIAFSGAKAYVSALYSDAVYVVNPATNAVLDTIRVGSGSEGLATAGGYLYVANNLLPGFETDNRITVVRTDQDRVVERWVTGVGPVQVQVVGAHLVVSCSGTWGGGNGEIVMHRLTDGAIVRRIPIPGFVGRFVLNDSGSGGWVLADGVRYFDLPTGATQAVNNRSFSAIGRYGEELWLGHPMDYVQRGWVLRAGTDGVVADSFRVGVAPGEILFSRN